MKSLESLISAPVIVSLLGGAQIMLRGRAGAEDIIIERAAAVTSPIDPVFGLSMLGVLLLTGLFLLAREMRAEARDKKEYRTLPED